MAAPRKLWNLEWRPQRGITFGFMEATWLDPAHADKFAKRVWFALPIMLLTAGLILPWLPYGREGSAARGVTS